MPDFDHTGGWKPSAYRAAIGRVILARVEVGRPSPPSSQIRRCPAGRPCTVG
uniref:Uncharacterized protein n=1 Tax=Phenylobacterium glaciei TaxID=2803784 RepID=A0A974SAS1_9CAUL|nr:hypothetical protein JKL49_07190 [Phenylobacterium glaciei]